MTSPLGIGFIGFLGLTCWWVYDAFQINKWARGEESAMNSSTSSGFEAPAAGATMLPNPPTATPGDIPSMSQPTTQSEAA